MCRQRVTVSKGWAWSKLTEWDASLLHVYVTSESGENEVWSYQQAQLQQMIKRWENKKLNRRKCCHYSNYSIIGPPFWDLWDSTVVIPWQFTTVITSLISNVVAWGRVKLTTTATVAKLNEVTFLGHLYKYYSEQHYFLVRLVELISFLVLNPTYHIFGSNLLSLSNLASGNKV